MIKTTIVSISIIVSFGFTLSLWHQSVSEEEINEQTKVQDLLIAYGASKPAHFLKKIDLDKVKKGEEIIHKGFTISPDGRKSKVISEYFVCTSCHNTVKETDNPANMDPDDRLQYAKEKDIPYLPGSTLWGITNRTSWYNGDYVEKYGDQAREAHKSLSKSIQLCASECSSGREMVDWELDAVLHYLTSLQITLGELKLSDNEWVSLRNFQDNPDYKDQMREMLESKYVTAYPATFPDIVPVAARKKGVKGNSLHGMVIFEQSCLHCHQPGGLAKTIFSEKDKDASWLVSYFHKDNGGSIYNITRTGTEPSKKTPQYMPIYTAEKLTNQQLEDLAAFLVEKSKNDK